MLICNYAGEPHVAAVVYLYLFHSVGAPCVLQCSLILQYESDCNLLVATPERGILMPGEEMNVALLLDGQSVSFCR